MSKKEIHMLAEFNLSVAKVGCLIPGNMVRVVLKRKTYEVHVSKHIGTLNSLGGRENVAGLLGR